MCILFLLLFGLLTCFLNSQAKDHTCRLVQSAVESGARLILDGRYIIVCICSLYLSMDTGFDYTKHSLNIPPKVKYASSLGYAKSTASMALSTIPLYVGLSHVVLEGAGISLNVWQANSTVN